jgi:prevent-host-death family protein
MSEITAHELRDNTRLLLDRVARGEEVTITMDGRPVAILQPVGRRPRWMGRDEFACRILSRQADPALAGELDVLAPDTTDGLPL